MEIDAARVAPIAGRAQGPRIMSVDPLALLESMVEKQKALQQHRGLVRERQAVRPSTQSS